jgi:hypothetical protein
MESVEGWLCEGSWLKKGLVDVSRRRRCADCNLNHQDGGVLEGILKLGRVGWVKLVVSNKDYLIM